MPNDIVQPPVYANDESDYSQVMTTAFYDGVRAACVAMRGDEVYYGPVNAKPGIAVNVRAVADFIEESIR